MIFLDELKPLTLYKKPFHLPIEEKDKKKGSSILLLTPNYESSINVMKNPLLINNKYFESYYIEKDITYFINQEGYLEDISDVSYRNVINETRRISNKIDGIEENSFVKSNEHPLFPYLNSNSEYEEILESSSNNLFFLSKDNMDNRTLTPRIPDNYFTKNGYEDNKTKRVCLAPSVSKALMAISQRMKDMELYVHVPVDEHEIYKPSLEEVPDRGITGEVWIKEPVKLQCIGKIRVIDDAGKPGKKFKYGDKEAELYDWTWEWKEKYGSFNEASDEVLNDPKRYMRSLKLKMNKAKYEIKRQSDNTRNNVGVEKDSKLNTDTPPNPGAGDSGDTSKPEVENIKEAGSYEIHDTMYYRKHMMTAVSTCSIKQGEVIDILDSELGRSIQGPSRDGCNVKLVNGEFIATENIPSGSNMYCYDVKDKIIEECTVLNESSDRSEIDKQYKSKGHLNLNSFKKTKVDDVLAKKHDMQCTASTLKDFKGYIYTDKKDNSLVAIVAVATYENNESWIQPIKVGKKYRGYGLSKQLLDIATREFGAKYLAVTSDNEIAIKIYKKYGFKIYKRVKYNGGIVYFMTIDSTQKINEEYVNESYLINKDDVILNLDSWEKEKGNNVLFVTGLSGSGKTTLGKEYSGKYNAELFELDMLGTDDEPTSPKNKKLLDAINKKFPNAYENMKNNKVDIDELILKMMNYTIKLMYDDPSTLYIIEGIHIFNFGIDVTNKPLVIKNTSMVTSILQRFKRNSDDGKIEWKAELKNEFIKLVRWYLSEEKKLTKFKKKNIKESYFGTSHMDYILEDTHMRCKTDSGDVVFAFNENLNEEVLNEANVSSTMLTKLLYKERFKNNKEVFEIYDKVKVDLPWVTRTFLDYDRYKQFNLFVDLSFYNQTFFKNNVYKMDKGVDLYFEFINRFINDKRLDASGYTKKTVIVPLLDWVKPEMSIYKFSDDINPISIIVRLMKTNATLLQKWKGVEFIFLTDNGYFKLDLSDLELADTAKFITLVDRLKKGTPIVDLDEKIESKKSIIANIVDKVETSQKIKVNNLTGKSEEITKDELVNKIEKAASVSSNTDDAIENLEEDDYIKNIISSLAAEEDNSVKINNSRSSRMLKLNDEFLNKKLRDTTVKDMLNTDNNSKELPVTSLDIDTVNEEWKNLQYINFETSYDIEEDILAALYSLSNKTTPISIRDIKVDDTSTTEDLKDTYTVQMEDINGERFTLKFDVPKFKDHKFMRLRGNDKTINGQLTQIPITKTDDDTVQVVSNYKKIFIKRYGTSSGKSFVTTDRIIKTIKKMESREIIATVGDNSRICNKYELPIDYIDLAANYSKLETRDYIVIFNQDEIRDKYKIDPNKGIPFAVNKSDKSVLYYDETYTSTFSSILLTILRTNNKEFENIYRKTSISNRYTYSKAAILNNEIPLIVIMGYNEGLTKSIKKGNIRYTLEEKRPSVDKDISDVIKFSDGYLVYDLNYNSSLLMNGLKQCNTEDYSLADINGKAMWLDFLDLFGGKILADGLDNFYDLMIDPITEEVLEYYKLPTDYIDILAYANFLLADNKYSKHTDMTARRYRSNELVAGYVYQSIADSYGRYRTDLKRNKKAKMSMKQTEILDKVLSDPTGSDSSILNALLEIEAINSVTYKGLVGMNADRAYGLDKRTYDDSMVNLLGLSTGFAGNVGITRQATLDMNITGKRGYIKISKDPNDMSITKTFTATEALTPFGSRRDDPFRTAMTFIQTAKHGMRVKNAMPSLITNGADQALPYMITDTFASKAKQDGKVIEKTDSYMIIKYKDGTNGFIDLREKVQKNSDGGFYVTLKLDSDLKLNSNVKSGQIVAYDKSSFSDIVGHTDDISYNIGTFAKIAIMNTDEGFEDSAIISDWLSDALTSEVVVKKEVVLPKNTNIYNMVKKGQAIQEGDKLMVFQNSFEEEDVNILLKNLVDDDDMISDLGRIPIKSKITGVVEDIKIYRTVEKEELSDSLRKKINETEKPISDMLKIMKKYDINYTDGTDANYKLDPTGKLKHVDDGVLIEFFLKYEDKMSIGDKIVYYSALKGVIKDIFPEGQEPYTDFRKDEKVHSLLSLGSVNGRMVGSVPIVGGINKVVIELDRKVKTMLDIPFKYLDEE